MSLSIKNGQQDQGGPSFKLKATGKAADTLAKGLTGNQGNEGCQGDQGSQGSQGSQGPQEGQGGQGGGSEQAFKKGVKFGLKLAQQQQQQQQQGKGQQCNCQA